MISKFDLIVNPYAGRGKSLLEVEKATSFFDGKNIKYTIHKTTERKHATHIAYELTKNNAECIVSCGGDGTIHEIINGIINAKKDLDKLGQKSNTYLAILPCGTGNDFLASMEMPLDTIEMAKKIINGSPKKIDAIKIDDIYEICFACHGIDVDVVHLVNAGKKKTKLSYLKNILKCIFKGIKYHFSIIIDENNTIEMDGIFASVLNGRRIAGGLDFCPKARVNDGLMDIILIEKHNPISTLLHLLKVNSDSFVDGKFVKHIPCKNVKISCNQDTIDIDGELFENKKFDAKIAPNILDIIL